MDAIDPGASETLIMRYGAYARDVFLEILAHAWGTQWAGTASRKRQFRWASLAHMRPLRLDMLLVTRTARQVDEGS